MPEPHPPVPAFRSGFLNPELLLSAIVDSSDDAIISKDLNSIVTSWNKAAERIFGYSAEEMIGMPITALIPPERRHEETEIISRLRRGERVEHFDSIRVRKDGTFVPVSLTISPIRDPSGLVVGASKIARDISERKEAEALLRRQKTELEDANTCVRDAYAEAEHQSRLKDEFLATLSHELRTPLQAILGWTQLLLNDEQIEEAEARRALQVIDRSARSQVRIIEDLLDMSRILSGRIRLDVQPVALATVLQAAVDTVRPAAESKNVHIECDFGRETALVIADASRLQQIFWNLLANAVKFTPAAGVVRVSIGRTNSHFEISITDTGAGISPDFLPHVFERFRQADATSTRRHGGVGLGLAIVKHLTELHGGMVSAKSPGPQKGAVFTVTLPAARTTAANDPPAIAQEKTVRDRRPRLDGTSVLVVDDEEDALSVLAATLRNAGATVARAVNAREALDSFRRVAPDVLISDVAMPERDGHWLIRQIRSLPKDKGGATPAVALSAFSRLEDRVAAIGAGFQMHLAKPADMLELLTIVASLARSGKDVE